MPKSPTLWKPQPSGTASASNAGFGLLTEAGGSLLTEAGGDILLEDTVISTKLPELWTPVAKSSTAWKRTDGFTTFDTASSYNVILQSGDQLITQAGDTRITQDSNPVPKAPTSWSET